MATNRATRTVFGLKNLKHMSIIAETKQGQKITSQQQGDDNEAFFQRYIEETYADGKPQFIDNTKYDSVHGIDKAFVMNNHLHLFIAEVKSRYSQVSTDKDGDKQTSKAGITKRLKKLQQQDPNHPLIIAIKKVLENNGEVCARTYRVMQNNGDKKPVQFTKGQENFTANELNAILNISPQSSPILHFSQGKNTMSTIVTSSQSIHNAMQIISSYAEALKEVDEKHSYQIMHLQSEWGDTQHANLVGEINNLSMQIQHVINRTPELIAVLQVLYQNAVNIENQRF
jgi:hypothetical protein